MEDHGHEISITHEVNEKQLGFDYDVTLNGKMTDSNNHVSREFSQYNIRGDSEARSSASELSSSHSLRKKSLGTRDEPSSSEPTSYNSNESSKDTSRGIPNLGRRGDPRMHRAVAVKTANLDPNFSLLDALRAGGFHFPNDNEISGKSDREIFDDEGVKLSQRKNQLTRRLRHIRKRPKLGSSSNSSTDQNSSRISSQGPTMGMGLLDQFVNYQNNMQMMNFPRIREASNIPFQAHYPNSFQDYVINDNMDIHSYKETVLPNDLSRFLTSTMDDMKIMPSDTQMQDFTNFKTPSNDQRMQLAKQFYYFEKQDLMIRVLLKAGYTAKEIAESPNLIAQFEEELKKSSFTEI
jgi:hypothetical protein